MTSRADLLREATARLSARGITSPRVDAELLLAHALGIERSRLSLVDEVPYAAEDTFTSAMLRRAGREPLQHILGQAPFRHIVLAVGPGVFIPRPETELLVDAASIALAAAELVVDLCAGSGALALSVADEFSTPRVIAVERDPNAQSWLRRNAAATRVEIVDGDVRDAGLLSEVAGHVDVVLSNPPYVPSTTVVDSEVRSDPDVAVFAGADGLDLIPDVIARAADLLRPGGCLVVEHDDTHGESVPRLLSRDGRWREIEDRLDLSGRPRYAVAVRA